MLAVVVPSRTGERPEEVPVERVVLNPSGPGHMQVLAYAFRDAKIAGFSLTRVSGREPTLGKPCLGSQKRVLKQGRFLFDARPP